MIHVYIKMSMLQKRRVYLRIYPNTYPWNW